MTQRFGIDTSVLIRLMTQDPQDIYERCVEQLSGLVEGNAEVFASNQVIGEAYITVQRFYSISAANARTALLDALTSGLVAPLNGRAVLNAIAASGGPGLFDRLIADDYRRAGLETLTLDRKMTSLPNVQAL